MSCGLWHGHIVIDCKKEQKSVIYLKSIFADSSTRLGISRCARWFNKPSGPGAYFSKLPVSTGPVKLFCFLFQKLEN